MANLKKMSVDQLLALRTNVGSELEMRRRELRQQLNRLDSPAVEKNLTSMGSVAGRKMPPKYRSKKDASLTWAGRGATPRWMRDEVKAGKLKRDSFLIK